MNSYVDNGTHHICFNCSVNSNCVDVKCSHSEWNSRFYIDSFHKCSVSSNCIDDKGLDCYLNSYVDIGTHHKCFNCSVYSVDNCVENKGSDSDWNS